MHDHKKKIVIVGYYGKGNFGDQLMLLKLLEHLQPYSLTVVAYDEVKFSFPDFPHKIIYNKRGSLHSRFSFFVELSRELAGAHLVFWGGGTCFYDNVSGGRGSLLGVLKMYLMSRMFRTKVGFAGIGIGELVHPLNVAITRFLMKHSDVVTLRDRQSYEYVKAINPRVRLADDLAFLAQSEGPIDGSSQGKKVVFCGMSHANKQGHDDATLALHVAEALDCLVEAGYRIEMVPMHLGKEADDNQFHRSVWALMKRSGQASIVQLRGIDQVESTWSVMRTADAVVSMRLHGLVAGVIAGKPIVAISDSSKIVSFLADNEIGECRLSLPDLCANPDGVLKRIDPEMCSKYMTAERVRRAMINIVCIRQADC